MLNILDKVILEDKKEYLVGSSARIAEENFYLLIDAKDSINIRYVKENEDGKSLVQIYDLDLLEDLVPVLYYNAKKFDEENK